LDLEGNRQVIENQIKYNFENGKEYARLTKTPYQNPMLNRQVLRTKERLVGHMSFLPLFVVWRDIWTWGLHRRQSSR
jgi:hypothetical protein